MGFARKGSLASVVAASVFSILYALAGYLIQKKNGNGKTLALGTSIVLLVFGIVRFMTVQKKMLPILFIVLGAFNSFYQYTNL